MSETGRKPSFLPVEMHENQDLGRLVSNPGDGTSAPTRIQLKACPTDLYFPAFNFAQRFFAPAIILAFASGLITLMAFFAAGATATTGAATEPALPFLLAHRALRAALILALVASLKIRVACFEVAGARPDSPTPLIVAHLAFAAARIFARLAALIVHFFFGAGVAGGVGDGVGADDGAGEAGVVPG